MKFKSTKEEETAKEILTQGSKGEFWKLIVKALQESRAFIEQQMESDDMKELTAEQYKLTNELFKSKKQFLDTLMKTPENIVSWLGIPSTDRPEFDPYDK